VAGCAQVFIRHMQARFRRQMKGRREMEARGRKKAARPRAIPPRRRCRLEWRSRPAATEGRRLCCRRPPTFAERASSAEAMFRPAARRTGGEFARHRAHSSATQQCYRHGPAALFAQPPARHVATEGSREGSAATPEPRQSPDHDTACRPVFMHHFAQAANAFACRSRRSPNVMFAEAAESGERQLRPPSSGPARPLQEPRHRRRQRVRRGDLGVTLRAGEGRCVYKRRR